MKGGGGSAPAAAAQVVRNGPDTFLEGKNWIWGQVGCGGVKEREESSKTLSCEPSTWKSAVEKGKTAGI